MTTITRSEAHTYAPVGRCIFCGSDGEPGGLQREHIVPFGLNGTLVLPKASCAACAKITSAFESFCLQRMFIDARTHLGLKSRGHRRNKKARPPLKIGHVGADNQTSRWQELMAGDHPFALATMDFAPAGILCGRSPEEDPKIEACLIPSPGFAERFSRLPENAAVHYTIDSERLALMLAKIAHAFAVATCGLMSFEPFLPDVILGRSPHKFHYVGGTPAEARDPKALHSLALQWRGNLMMVYVKLFAMLDAPAYLVVVGRTHYLRGESSPK